MTALRAADSWLVVDGRIRAVERHWARFSAACGEHGVGPEALATFRARVERAVPAHGRWFPRIEIRADGELAVLVRPAPSREPTVVAWVADVPDPRRSPRRKGPDLDRLAALRERAAAHGAGEAVLAERTGSSSRARSRACCGGRGTRCGRSPTMRRSSPGSRGRS
jgi:branched-subunit amino acid aminotransferase/4-amino-4-deoxychorismate lyase